jgi:hypothetical protein
MMGSRDVFEALLIVHQWGEGRVAKGSDVLAGIYMIIEIGLLTVATCIAVIIMFIHSRADYDQPVPVALLFLTRTATLKCTSPARRVLEIYVG